MNGEGSRKFTFTSAIWCHWNPCHFRCLHMASIQSAYNYCGWWNSEACTPHTNVQLKLQLITTRMYPALHFCRLRGFFRLLQHNGQICLITIEIIPAGFCIWKRSHEGVRFIHCAVCTKVCNKWLRTSIKVAFFLFIYGTKSEMTVSKKKPSPCQETKRWRRYWNKKKEANGWIKAARWGGRAASRSSIIISKV